MTLLSEWAKSCSFWCTAALEHIEKGEEVVGYNGKAYTCKDDYIDACILQVATTIASGKLTRDITIVQALRLMGILE